uniref:Uncharacterized protein n=1 Tax=Pristionchus pacificus TaxID=54126 RepID=A0A2A6BAB4_PRIPA|eukprot:PDM62822.1 hypothetical protein PRIPAC_50037 [Pristionchus pacificus]
MSTWRHLEGLLILLLQRRFCSTGLRRIESNGLEGGSGCAEMWLRGGRRPVPHAPVLTDRRLTLHLRKFTPVSLLPYPLKSYPIRYFANVISKHHSHSAAFLPPWPLLLQSARALLLHRLQPSEACRCSETAAISKFHLLLKIHTSSGFFPPAAGAAGAAAAATPPLALPSSSSSIPQSSSSSILLTTPFFLAGGGAAAGGAAAAAAAAGFGCADPVG